MLVPKLRFKREDGTDYPVWEEQNLLQALIEKKEYNTLSSECPLLTSSRTGLMYQNEYRDNASTSNQSTLFSVVNRGDCTYRHMSDDSIFHFNINTLCDKGLVSKEYPVFTARNEFNLAFVVTHLNSSTRFLEFCRQQKKGGTRTRLYFKTLCNYKMAFPCLEEQQKIADFLSTVDEVIAQSEAEVQNLEQQKKAAMQKIFSQEVRFKREDGTDYPEWEEKAITDLCEDIVGGGTPSTDNKAYWSGDIAWVSSSDLENNNIHHLSMTRFITENAITNSATKRIPYNSILIVSRVGVGKVAIAPCELCTSQDFTNLVNPICNPIFLGYLLSLTMQIKANGVQGTSIKGVTAKEIKQYYLSIPHIEEQQKIADFLSAYDEAISYAKQELDKWKELKKGLLQQMFV